MQKKLAQVQKDIGEQLERYEYLVDDKTERSMTSTPAQTHGISHPGNMGFDEDRSLEQRAEMKEAGDASPARPYPDVALADTSTPDAACPRPDNELTTYFQKQEKGHQPGVMRAVAENEALGYM